MKLFVLFIATTKHPSIRCFNIDICQHVVSCRPSVSSRIYAFSFSAFSLFTILFTFVDPLSCIPRFSSLPLPFLTIFSRWMSLSTFSDIHFYPIHTTCHSHLTLWIWITHARIGLLYSRVFSLFVLLLLVWRPHSFNLNMTLIVAKR